MKQKIRVLIGPTASGKTAYALDIAQAENAVIINMDAMQMYRDLRIITARPTPEEEAQAEHRLYGVLEAEIHGNAALWSDMAAAEIRLAWQAGKLPLLVGGTGMYLKCLMEGLPYIPAISESSKKKYFECENPYKALKELDAAMAERLESGDSQRIQRALEVYWETGRSLLDWQADPVQPTFPDADYEVESLLPPREIVYDNINRRFEIMVEEGALEEVHLLKQKSLADKELPILKAHGVPEIMRYLDGDMTLEDAIHKGQQNTRNYAKRQMTWIRNQLPDALPLMMENG